MSDVQSTVITMSFVLWFAIAWYLNIKFKELDRKIDRLFETFDGLREYLYEIDPQFDDERNASNAFESGNSLFAEMNELELLRKKREEGTRHPPY